MSADPNRNEEWKAFEEGELRAGRCPYSGENLSRHGEEGPDCWSCVVCDCFGYELNDPRIGVTR